jgi:hypothetical protein
MAVDLDAIKARLAELEGRMPYTEWLHRVAASQKDAAALVAEVEELRVRLDACRAHLNLAIAALVASSDPEEYDHG